MAREAAKGKACRMGEKPPSKAKDLAGLPPEMLPSAAFRFALRALTEPLELDHVRARQRGR